MSCCFRCITYFNILSPRIAACLLPSAALWTRVLAPLSRHPLLTVTSVLLHPCVGPAWTPPNTTRSSFTHHIRLTLYQTPEIRGSPIPDDIGGPSCFRKSYAAEPSPAGTLPLVYSRFSNLGVSGLVQFRRFGSISKVLLPFFFLPPPARSRQRPPGSRPQTFRPHGSAPTRPRLPLP